MNFSNIRQLKNGYTKQKLSQNNGHRNTKHNNIVATLGKLFTTRMLIKVLLGESGKLAGRMI